VQHHSDLSFSESFRSRQQAYVTEKEKAFYTSARKEKVSLRGKMVKRNIMP